MFWRFVSLINDDVVHAFFGMDHVGSNPLPSEMVAVLLLLGVIQRLTSERSFRSLSFGMPQGRWRFQVRQATSGEFFEYEWPGA